MRDYTELVRGVKVVDGEVLTDCLEFDVYGRRTVAEVDLWSDYVCGDLSFGLRVAKLAQRNQARRGKK
jgi:hypothetical protein